MSLREPPRPGSSNTALSAAVGEPTSDTRMSVVLRRVASISTMLAAAALMLATAPIWIPVAWLLDRVLLGQTALLGCALAFTWYLGCELAGVVAAFWLWIMRRNRADYVAANFALQRWWARTLFAGASRFLGLRLDVQGGEHASQGPCFILPRHVTTLDTLIPTLVASVPHGIHLRVVMKRELLWDPCLDIVGHRLKNAFVRREGGDRTAEIERVRDLARDLGPHEAVLLYPEGTRFTESKRERVIASLRAKGDTAGAARAASYSHVLPPRFGGVLAMLETRPDVDVVFLCHSGLERMRTLGDLWRGGLRGLTIKTRLWRVPASRIPESEEDRKHWLLAEWRRVDEWVAQAAEARSVSLPAPAVSSRLTH